MDISGFFKWDIICYELSSTCGLPPESNHDTPCHYSILGSSREWDRVCALLYCFIQCHIVGVSKSTLADKLMWSHILISLHKFSVEIVDCKFFSKTLILFIFHPFTYQLSRLFSWLVAISSVYFKFIGCNRCNIVGYSIQHGAVYSLSHMTNIHINISDSLLFLFFFFTILHISLGKVQIVTNI